MKTCKSCKESLPHGMFYVDQKSKDKLSYMCIKCTSEDNARRYQKNRELRIAKAKREYDNDPEKFRALKRAYRKKPYIKAAEAQRKSDWNSKNKHKVIAYTAKRRAVKLNAAVKWLSDLSELVFEEAALLAKMRKEHTGIAWEVDHIVPLQSKLVCGLHTFSNIAVVPASVNRSKSNRYWADMHLGV